MRAEEKRGRKWELEEEAHDRERKVGGTTLWMTKRREDTQD